MDFELTDEQQLIRDAVREFAEAEIVPLAAEIDRDHRFPAELLPKLAPGADDENRSAHATTPSRSPR